MEEEALRSIEPIAHHAKCIIYNRLLGNYMSNLMLANREIFLFQNYRIVNEVCI